MKLQVKAKGQARVVGLPTKDIPYRDGSQFQIFYRGLVAEVFVNGIVELKYLQRHDGGVPGMFYVWERQEDEWCYVVAVTMSESDLLKLVCALAEMAD